MRRLALTTERRVGHKLIALAERQHKHSLPVLDTHPFSQGTDWTLRRCCTQSIAREPESMDPVEFNAAHLTKRKRETLDGVVGTRSMLDTTAHLTHCARVIAVDNLGVLSMPDMSSKSFLTSDSCRVEASKCATGEMDIADVKFETTALLRDEFVEHAVDGSIFGTMSALDYLEEHWDEALEQAVSDASDSCMHNKRMKSFSQVIPPMNEEAAMSDMQLEPSYVARCKDEDANYPTANIIKNGFKSLRTQSIEALKVGIDGIGASDCSVSHHHLKEGFVTQNIGALKEAIYELCDDDRPFDIPLKFSKQQMEVLEAVAYGKSVFITGSAGTGKSFLLLYIIRVLKKALGENRVYVTASTGIAACALKGITLHSFAGIGLGGGTPNRLAARILRSKDLSKRWNETAVLVIDEISMIDGELFDKLEYVARRARKSAKCFGGIQLIVTGDFFQLPPVNPPNMQKFFAFEAECWNKCFDMQVELEHVFRQSDSVFVKMLNEIRKGIHTPETLEKLELCHRALPDDGSGIVPTRLYPLKVDVREENMQELRALQTSIITFFAVDYASDPLHRYRLRSMRSEKELQLCVGAQVMLAKNLDTKGGLVNGAKGVVMGFQVHSNVTSEDDKSDESKAVKRVAHLVSPSGYWPIVRFSCGVKTIGPCKDAAEDGGVEVVSRIQVPLILAWALSVHKCQGMTLSKVETDLSKAFDYGMVYVALSRVKDLDGLQLTGYDPTRIKVHPNVVAFSDKITRECTLLKQEEVG